MFSRSSTLLFCLLALMTFSACGTPSEVGAEEFMVEAGHAKLYVRIAGDRQADNVLIAIHGGPGNSSDYMLSLEELQEDEIVIVTYDQRGTGRSSEPPEGYTIMDYVEDLEAVRKAVGSEEIHLFGHSWGGIVAMRYATVYPQRVKTLILMGSGPPTAEAARAAQENLAQRIIELQEQGKIDKEPPSTDEELLLNILPAYFSDASFEMPDEMKGMSYNQRVADRTFAALGDWDFTSEVGLLQHSVLMLWGEDDPFGLSMAEATKTALTSSNVEFELLESCGHFWHECPQEFTSRVRAFLGLPSTP